MSMEQVTVITTEGVEAEALRLAQGIVDYDRKDDETRRAGDNKRRLIRLDLGALICSAPDPEHLKQVIIANTQLGKGEVQDIHDVAAFNKESGYQQWLYDDVMLSFTQNRNLALIKVASKTGAMPTVQQRMDALHDNIVRNGGVVKEDKVYREALNILPPPNSADNIIERMRVDPEFRKEMDAKGLVVIDDDPPPPPPPPEPIDPWVHVVNELRAVTIGLRNRAFDDPNTPLGVYDECGFSMEDLAATRDLIVGRNQLANDLGGGADDVDTTARA